MNITLSKMFQTCTFCDTVFGLQATMDLLGKTLPNGLDYLVCNAGVEGKRMPAANESTASILEVFNTNVFGVLEVIRAALPLMRRGSQRTVCHRQY